MPNPDEMPRNEPPEWLREIFKPQPGKALPDFDREIRELERKIKEPA